MALAKKFISGIPLRNRHPKVMMAAAPLMHFPKPNLATTSVTKKQDATCKKSE
jgi:hypothetical protein